MFIARGTYCSLTMVEPQVITPRHTGGVLVSTTPAQRVQPAGAGHEGSVITLSQLLFASQTFFYVS